MLEKEELLVTSNSSYSHSAFKRLVLQTRKNQGLFGKGLTFNPFPNKPLSLHVCSISLENTVGTGEIVPNEQFFLFPVFSTRLENFLPFSSNLKLSSANSLSLEESKICRLGN